MFSDEVTALFTGREYFYTSMFILRLLKWSLQVLMCLVSGMSTIASVLFNASMFTYMTVTETLLISET